jgi:hypothetical protein
VTADLLAALRVLADEHRAHGRGFYAFCILCNANETEDRLRALFAAHQPAEPEVVICPDTNGAPCLWSDTGGCEPRCATEPAHQSERTDTAEVELRTPQEWCDALGARVMDPDGWRDGTRDWSESITREEFDGRLIRCTIDGHGYPTFIGRAAQPSEPDRGER